MLGQESSSIQNLHSLRKVSLLQVKKAAPRPRFSPINDVFLIPTRSDMAHYIGDLHWTAEDCASFKLSAIHQLRNFIKKQCCTQKEALFRLYQLGEAGDDTYD